MERHFLARQVLEVADFRPRQNVDFQRRLSVLLSREIARAIKDPKIAQMIESNGFTPIGNTADEFSKALGAEIAQNAEIVRKYPDIR